MTVIRLTGLPSVKLGFKNQYRGNFLSDKFSLSVLLFCLATVIFGTLMIVSTWHKLPLQLPLFYSRPWGEGILAPYFAIWLLPIMTIINVCINYFILTLAKVSLFINRVLLIFSFLVALMSFYALLKIITLLV